MAQTALQRLRHSFSSLGLGKSVSDKEDPRFYNASELACLKQQLQDGNVIARDVAKRNGACLNPRIAAMKANAKRLEEV